jgi:hypothetical protein
MSQMIAETLPALRQDDTVTEQFADGTVGCTFHNGVVHLELWAMRTDYSVEPPRQYRKITIRLAMTLNAALDLQQRIANISSLLQKHGIAVPVMSGSQTLQ